MTNSAYPSSDLTLLLYLVFYQYYFLLATPPFPLLGVNILESSLTISLLTPYVYPTNKSWWVLFFIKSPYSEQSYALLHRHPRWLKSFYPSLFLLSRPSTLQRTSWVGENLDYVIVWRDSLSGQGRYNRRNRWWQENETAAFHFGGSESRKRLTWKWTCAVIYEALPAPQEPTSSS